MSYQTTLFILLALFTLNIESFSQKDTIYIDPIGTIVSKDSAKYYRFISQEDSGLYKIEDYFLTDKLQMTGYATSPEAVIKVGKYVFYDSIGNVSSEGVYNTNGFRSGEWIYYFKHSSKISSIRKYNSNSKAYYVKYFDSLSGKIGEEGSVDENSRATGVRKIYYFNSDSLSQKRNYVAGSKEGIQYEYYRNGAIKRIEVFESNKRIDGKQFNEDGKKIDYFPSLEFPEPPEPLYKYLIAKVKCFESVLAKGKFRYKFIVHSDGSLSDIEIMNVDDRECKAEIAEKLSKMKKWKPAKRENVPYNYTMESGLKY
jgi:antitoxin component YwqK of YwqJK toxin-antitoxin module